MTAKKRNGFGSYKLANRMVTQIEEICRRIIQEERPAPRYAVVESVEHERAYVRYPGDEDPVPVPLTSVTPLPGQTVVIGGLKGDRHIVETVGRPLEGDTSTVFLDAASFAVHTGVFADPVPLTNLAGLPVKVLQDNEITTMRRIVPIPDAWKSFSAEVLLTNDASSPSGHVWMQARMDERTVEAGYELLSGGHADWALDEVLEIDINTTRRVTQALILNDIELKGMRPFLLERNAAGIGGASDTFQDDVHFLGVLLKRVK